MRSSVKAAIGATVAAVGLVAALVIPSAATTTSPNLVEGTGSCTTDATGVCTISHNLGVAPDSVVVAPATPGAFNAFMLNVVGGSFTASSFKVRAMFSPTQPKANGTIWVAYVASVGEQGTPPLPPPSSSTPSPPSSSIPSSPPPSTSVPSSPSAPPSSSNPSPGACANPTVFAEQDGGDFGPYYIHNNAWNWQGAGSGQHETLYACSASSWWVDDYGFAPNNGEVYMYPNVHQDINGGNGKPLSTFPNKITGKFAGKGPGAGSYDVAWDLWLNGLADKNSFELMVWTEQHGNAEPAGNKVAVYTDASTGQVYDVWWDGTHTNQAYLAYVSRNTQYSGTVDLRGMIVNAQKQGYLPAGDTTVNQIDYGNEVRDTAGATAATPYRFSLTDFGLTLN